MSEDCLLNLVVTPEVEDTVADWLLEHPIVTGFSSYPISGHGSSEQGMTLAEQVVGRRRQLVFQLHLSCVDAQTLLADFKQAFRGGGMHYWLLPVIDAGHVD